MNVDTFCKRIYCVTYVHLGADVGQRRASPRQQQQAGRIKQCFSTVVWRLLFSSAALFAFVVVSHSYLEVTLALSGCFQPRFVMHHMPATQIKRPHQLLLERCACVCVYFCLYFEVLPLFVWTFDMLFSKTFTHSESPPPLHLTPPTVYFGPCCACCVAAAAAVEIMRHFSAKNEAPLWFPAERFTAQEQNWGRALKITSERSKNWNTTQPVAGHQGLCWPKHSQKSTFYHKYDNKHILHCLFFSHHIISSLFCCLHCCILRQSLPGSMKSSMK